MYTYNVEYIQCRESILGTRKSSTDHFQSSLSPAKQMLYYGKISRDTLHFRSYLRIYLQIVRIQSHNSDWILIKSNAIFFFMYLCCFLFVRMKRGRGLFGTFRQNSEFSGLCINFCLEHFCFTSHSRIWRVTIGYNNLFLSRSGMTFR